MTRSPTLLLRRLPRSHWPLRWRQIWPTSQSRKPPPRFRARRS